MSPKKQEGNFYGLKPQKLELKDLKSLKINLDSIKTINIPRSLHENPKDINFSNLLDTCFAIPLETNSDNLIGHIDEIKIYKGKIYILDITKAKAVFVFNFEGKYLGRIGKNGNGPGEYPQPEGVEIDKKNQEILISNAAIRKILRYTLDGKFIGEINPNIGNLDFKILDNGTIALLGGNQKNEHLGKVANRIIYIIDKSGKIISYGPIASSDYSNIQMMLGSNSMVNNNGISYSYNFSDTIYSLNKDEIKAQYRINFENWGIDREKLRSKNYKEFSDVVFNKSKIVGSFQGFHLQTKDYLYFSYNCGNTWFPCFYNKNQSKTILGKITSDSCYYTGPFIAANDDYFIAAAEAARIIEFEKICAKNKFLSKTHKVLLKCLKNESGLKLKDDDNPVLFFYKFKKEYNEN